MRLACPVWRTLVIDGSDGRENGQGLDGLIERAGAALADELSLWFDDAEGRESASEGLGEVISDWEDEHGSFTPKELKAARTQLFG